MSTYSSNLGLTLQTTGENAGTWGDVTNVNLGTFLEQSVTGYQSLTFASADLTLTLVDGSSATTGNNYARNMYLECTGTLGAARNLIVPTTRKKLYIVKHSADNFGITVKTSAGIGITVPQNQTIIVYCNGTNVVAAVDYFSSFTAAAINNTPVGATTQASGSFTTLAASSTVSGTGFTTYFASPPAIGGTAAAAVTGTTVTANTGFVGPLTGTVGAGTTNTGAFTSLSASGLVSLSPANTTVTLSPTGTGTVTINPTAASTINNASVGVTTPAGGRFTFAHTAPVVVTFSATVMAIDCALSNVFTTTFTATVTAAPTISNPKDGQTINWFITQDATGSRLITGFWPSGFKWPGGTAGVLSTAANSVDLVVATYRSATGFWYATLSKAFA